MEFTCHYDGQTLIPAWQAPVLGYPTICYTCASCGGTATFQVDGTKFRQIHLTGAPEEFRPWESYRPGYPVDTSGIKPAFSLGSGLKPEHRFAYAQAAQAYNQAAHGMNGYTQQQAQAAYARAVAAHMTWLQQQAQATGQPGYTVRQPVAYTLGPHTNPIQPLPPDELRRKLLGRSQRR